MAGSKRRTRTAAWLSAALPSFWIARGKFVSGTGAGCGNIRRTDRRG